MKRVAVVEDSPEIRLFVTVLLSRAYEVDQYSDGQEALDGFAKRRPDLVLLDISLPRIDGTEVLARMRSEAADALLQRIPVIAFTAYASESERQRFLDIGFDDHISKPVTDFQLFLETVDRLLHRAG
jgi:CheY-like chemotaxis protein